MEIKMCRECFEKFEASTKYFYKNKYNADGLDHKCKPCKNYETSRYVKKSLDNLNKIDGVIYKQCSKCQEWKVREVGFEKVKISFRSACIECRNTEKMAHQNKKKLAKLEADKLEKLQNEKEEIAYKKFVNEPKYLGIRNKKVNIEFENDKKYKVKSKDESFIGELVQATDNFIVLKHPLGYNVSFQFKEMLLGECKISEV